MAKELLSDAALAGEVKCVYRHEVEAFVAVLVWIVCRYQDGKVRANSPLEHWIQRSHLECRRKRGRTFDQIAMGNFPQPTSVPKEIWIRLCLTLRDMRELSDDALRARIYHELHKFYEERGSNPDFHHDSMSPDDYDTLQALPRVLAWSIFEHDTAKKYTCLLNEHILKLS